MAKDKSVPDRVLLMQHRQRTVVALDHTHFKKQPFGVLIGEVKNRIFTKLVVQSIDTTNSTLIMYMPELGIVVSPINYKSLLYHSRVENGYWNGEYTLVRNGKGIYVASIHQPEFDDYTAVNTTCYNVGDHIKLIDGQEAIYLGIAHRYMFRLNELSIQAKENKSTRVHVYKNPVSNTIMTWSAKEKCTKIIEQELCSTSDCLYMLNDYIQDMNTKTITPMDIKPFTFGDIYMTLDHNPSTTKGHRCFVIDDKIVYRYDTYHFAGAKFTQHEDGLIQLVPDKLTMYNVGVYSNNSSNYSHSGGYLTKPYTIGSKRLDVGVPIYNIYEYHIKRNK